MKNSELISELQKLDGNAFVIVNSLDATFFLSDDAVRFVAGNVYICVDTGNEFRRKAALQQELPIRDAGGGILANGKTSDSGEHQ